MGAHILPRWCVKCYRNCHALFCCIAFLCSVVMSCNVLCFFVARFNEYCLHKFVFCVPLLCTMFCIRMAWYSSSCSSTTQMFTVTYSSCKCRTLHHSCPLHFLALHCSALCDSLTLSLSLSLSPQLSIRSPSLPSSLSCSHTHALTRSYPFLSLPVFPFTSF